MKKSYALDIKPEWLATQDKLIAKYAESAQERDDRDLFLEGLDSKHLALLFSELQRVVVGVPGIGTDRDTSSHS